MDGGHHKTCVQWQPFGDPALQIAVESQPPIKPAAPSGPTGGKAGEEYTYTGSTTDPENNDIYYRWDWGDETYSQWLGPYNSGGESEESHIWNEEGSFEIRIQAKDINGKISEWSDPLPVNMPKTKMFRFDILQKYSFFILEFITQILKLKNNPLN
jgi:hypothetical protein